MQVASIRIGDWTTLVERGFTHENFQCTMYHRDEKIASGSYDAPTLQAALTNNLWQIGHQEEKRRAYAHVDRVNRIN